MRRTRWTAPALVLLLLTAAASRSGGQEPGVEAPAGPVKRFRLIVEGGQSVDWSPRGDRIAYSRPDDDGYLQLWVADPDGSNGRCLTCGPLEFRRRHAANPTWHPSGDYVVFQLEEPHRIDGAPVPFEAVPGRNRGDDLWAIRAVGRQFWNLTNRGDGVSRVHSPHFSHEGDKLMWTERVASAGGLWGRWEVRIAAWEVSRGSPRLKKARGYVPGSERRFCESYGFDTDDRGVLLAASHAPGQPEDGLDLYLLPLEGGEIRRLTDTADELDRFASLAPNGRKLVWATSRDLPGRREPFGRTDVSAYVPLDLWMMDADGHGAVRLTGFSDVFSDEYLGGEVMVGRASWSLDGDRLIVPVVPVGRTRTGGGLYLVELDEPYGR